MFETLRNEISEQVKRQETLKNYLFTILGLTCAFATWYENVEFLLLILFIGLILLARIIQSRNVVYYVSAYIAVHGDVSSEESNYERRLQEFRKYRYIFSEKHFIFKFVNSVVSIIKNCGNLVLSSFLLIQIIRITEPYLESNKLNYFYIVIGLIIYVMIFIFTMVICFDTGIRDDYEQAWKNIIESEA